MNKKEILKTIKNLKEETDKLSSQEQNDIKEFILENFSFKAYELISEAEATMNQVDIGSVLTVKELVKIGFNFVTICNDKDNKIEAEGYTEDEFEELLDKKVEVRNFYRDTCDYPCVEAAIIIDPFPNFVYDETKTFEADCDGDITRGILDKDFDGNYYIVEREGEMLSFLVTDDRTIKEVSHEEVLFETSLKNSGFNVEHFGQGNGSYYEISQYTPLGEDWHETIWLQKDRSIIEAFTKFANEFNVDDEVEFFLAMRGKNGVPSSIEALLNDAKWKKQKLIEAFEEIKKEV